MADDFHYSRISYPGIGTIETYCRSSKLLSVQEAANRLHVSRRTAYRMVADGLLASVPRGGSRGRIAVPVEEVESYLDSLKTSARRLTA